jgi:K(+)-stimulated pyrophosphate-energized sodium pump
MNELAGYIADGAMAFLRAEWKILSYFVVVAGIAAGVFGHYGCYIKPGYCYLIFDRGFPFGIRRITWVCALLQNQTFVLHKLPKPVWQKRLKYRLQVVLLWALGVAGLAIIGLGSLFIVFYTMYVVK